MYSATLVGIEWRKFASSCSSDRPARAPSTRRSASALGTKPCQRTRVAARLDVRPGGRVGLADQLDRDAVRGQQPAELDHLGRAAVRGEPADVDDPARAGRRRRRRGDVGGVGHHRVGRRRSGRCSRARPGSGAGGARPAARRRARPRPRPGAARPGSQALVVSAAAVSSCTSQTVGGRRRPAAGGRAAARGRARAAGRRRPPARPWPPWRRAARRAGAGRPRAGW